MDVFGYYNYFISTKLFMRLTQQTKRFLKAELGEDL